MLWSITIGRFGGTEVKIHITFILFLAWIAFSAWARGGPAAALDSTLFIVLLFACVVLHDSAISWPPAATASARPR